MWKLAKRTELTPLGLSWEDVVMVGSVPARLKVGRSVLTAPSSDV